jgi:hypothetical protein
MKRMAAFVVLLVLIAACGDDDSVTTESSDTATETTGAAVEPTTTTTVAETTTTAAAMTGPAAFIAMAQDYLGEYRGQWENATFGSSGDLYFRVAEANTEAGFILVEVDIDGNAFGASDPDQFVMEIYTMQDGFGVGGGNLLGDVVFEADEAGNFVVSASPDALGGMMLDVEGSLTADGFSGTYDIPGLANGTWQAAPAG